MKIEEVEPHEEFDGLVLEEDSWFTEGEVLKFILVENEGQTYARTVGRTRKSIHTNLWIDMKSVKKINRKDYPEYYI